jgi:predicted nucleic acid-binding protein
MTAFADTFFFLAFLNPRDAWHDEAVAQMERYAGQMVTTEWVLVELADAMSDPRDRRACAEFIQTLKTDPDVRIELSSPVLFD